MSSPYIERLKLAVEQLHRCAPVHVATAPVHEVFNGKTLWQGDVEIFRINHPRAKRCFAWFHRDEKGERLVAVLEIPPIVSPVTAVRAQVVKDVKDSYSD